MRNISTNWQILVEKETNVPSSQQNVFVRLECKEIPIYNLYGQRVATRRLCLLEVKSGRQVVCMNAYEIIMIIIASMTLLLKLIQVIKDLLQK